MTSRKSLLAIAATSTLTGGLLLSSHLSAAQQFEMTEQSFSTMTMTTTPLIIHKEKCEEGKCGEGKCGEGKCGEGKCGEGKCGQGKCK